MPEADHHTRAETGAPPRPVLFVAAVLVLALAITAAVFGLNSDTEQPLPHPGSAPLALVPVPAPAANAPACGAVLRAVPDTLRTHGVHLPRRELAAPAPAATVAWGAEPIVLRCGLPRPAELTPTSALRVVNGVQWLRVPGAGSATWYVVDRDVYAALTVPASAGTGPLQTVSDTISATLPPRPLRF